MPFIEINGANIYYQAYGQDHPGQAPILLIHGSTSIGQDDWGLAAPLLARRWRVIVPDCRGHGQSSNPGHSYSFKELAADTAALVRALGYPTAHVIGHSNGGNVALVTLLEHPEVIQTCIPQAANAYVSPDLIEKEPAIFDPDRVAREAPDWMSDMIRRHAPTQGPDYWRDLLRLTVDEIIREPNYTAEQLAQVNKPVLVIQGAQDRVNAPYQHAQFIARHIPYAEVWIPEGIGHTVHNEKLLEWVQKVEDFLTRRGDPANEAVYHLKRDRYADEREGLFEVSVAQVENQARLSGRVLTEVQRRAAVEAVQASGANVEAGELTVLLRSETPWALINRAVTDLRRQPRSLAERVSQGLLGETARILDESGDWSLVRLEHDGYVGWAHTAALHRCTLQETQTYQAACRWRVAGDLLPAWGEAQPGAGQPNTRLAGKLPFGVLVSVEKEQDDQAAVRLPDGRLWWVGRAGLLPLGHCPCPDLQGISQTLALIQRFVGVPYLWGGRSPFGYDCSGLAGIFYAFMGVTIPRDADQQYRAGIPVSGPAQPGDLLYFGELDEGSSSRFASITHVGISLGGDEIIHANGSAWGVSYNSLHPDGPLYRPWLREHLAGIRRFV